MAIDEHLAESQPQRGDQDPIDIRLIDRLRTEDGSALRLLMDRYDRLVRYTIFRASRDRCLRDPQWLESIASTTWAGFVRAVQPPRNQRPVSVSAYLVRIARNQTAGAYRNRTSNDLTFPLALENSETEIPSELDEPFVLLEKMELLERLAACRRQLSEEDGLLMSQLQAIVERRWRDAAAALDMKESTLRSRWAGTLKRLRACLARKT